MVNILELVLAVFRFHLLQRKRKHKRKHNNKGNILILELVLALVLMPVLRPFLLYSEIRIIVGHLSPWNSYA